MNTLNFFNLEKQQFYTWNLVMFLIKDTYCQKFFFFEIKESFDKPLKFLGPYKIIVIMLVWLKVEFEPVAPIPSDF